MFKHVNQKIKIVVIALTAILSGAVVAEAQRFDISVDFADKPKPQPRFWQSTGMSPAEMLLTNDMNLTLRMMNAAHDDAFRYIRPHYLLDLVTAERKKQGELEYDLTRLYEALDPIVNNDIALIFELMGNPSGIFDNFDEREQVFAWRDFVEFLATSLTDRYGRETVESWFFETTNEPDIHPFWPQTFQAFLNYYDASSEGLKAANPKLRFGGPATGRFLSPALKVLLAHCDTGINYLTGERGVRLDFISFHVKALPHQMVRFEQHFIEYIQNYHPKFADLPILNDEADPIGGWGIPYWWRTGPWHGAFVAQSIDLHNQVIVDELGANLVIAAGDNAFQGIWEKRTLLARFLVGDNNVEQWGSSDPGGWKPWDQLVDERPVTENFYLVKKPGMTAMSLAALLGNQRFDVEGFPPLRKVVDNYLSDAPHLGCTATKREDELIVLLCYNAPNFNLAATIDGDGSKPTPSQLKLIEESDAVLDLTLSNLPARNYQFTQFHIDSEKGTADAVWRSMGSPQDLSIEQFKTLQKAQDPYIARSEPASVSKGKLNLEIDMAAPSVTAIVLSPANAKQEVPQVSNVSEQVYSGGNGEQVSHIIWDVPEDAPLTLFDIYYADAGSKKFAKVNDHSILDNGMTIADTAKGGTVRIIASNVFGEKAPAVEYVIK